jgi:hypothetical protein
MNRIAIALISLLLTSAETYPGTVTPAIAPPVQALSAGFGKLGFDEEFKAPLDIGYGTTRKISPFQKCDLVIAACELAP